MKVILTKDHHELGLNGSMVDVSEGYARNYLIPNNMAVRATKNVLAHYENRKKARAKKEAAILADAQKRASELEQAVITVQSKVGEEGKLYGTVTSKEITEILHRNHEVTVDKKQVEIPNAIKFVGEHKVHIKLHPSVVASVKVVVQAADA